MRRPRWSGLRPDPRFARACSTTKAAPPFLNVGKRTSAKINIAGEGVNTGAEPLGYVSKVSAFELGIVSGQATLCTGVSPLARGADIQYAGAANLPLAPHCEEPTLSGKGQMHEGAVSAELGLAGWPGLAESVMVARDLALAGVEGRRLHLLHLSARESVDALRAALAAGVPATAEATPHHLCLTDEAVRSLDPNVKMNPPLGSRADRQALLEAAAPSHVEAVRRNFVEAMTEDDYAALGRAFAAVLAVLDS